MEFMESIDGEQSIVNFFLLWSFFFEKLMITLIVKHTQYGGFMVEIDGY
jgi:hypothetical protein